MFLPGEESRPKKIFILESGRLYQGPTWVHNDQIWAIPGLDGNDTREMRFTSASAAMRLGQRPHIPANMTIVAGASEA